MPMLSWICGPSMPQFDQFQGKILELFHIFGVTCVDQIYLRMKHLGAILFALLLVVAVAEDDGARRIRELRELAAKSPGKIIPIDGREFKEYLLKSPRPYYGVIYFTAQSCSLCESLYGEYEYLATLYQKSGAIDQQKNPIFFFKIEYNEKSAEIYKMFDFTTAPNLVVSKPRMAVLSEVEFKKHLQDHKWAISHSDGHVTTHKMLEFVNKRTGKDVIYKPTFSAMLTTIGVFLAVAVTGVFAYTKLKKFWMRWEVWFVGSLIIYITCVSGVVYDVIHDVPFVGSDGKGNIQVFSKGNREQYGAEGLIISLLISFIGICFIMIHIFTKVLNKYVSRVLAIVLLILVFFFVKILESAYRDKGWYNPMYYPPSDYQKGWYLGDQGNNI